MTQRVPAYHFPKSLSHEAVVELGKNIERSRTGKSPEEEEEISKEVCQQIQATIKDIENWTEQILGVDVSKRLRISPHKIHLFDDTQFEQYKERERLLGSWRAFVMPLTRELFVSTSTDDRVEIVALVHELVHLASYACFFPSTDDVTEVHTRRMSFGVSTRSRYDAYNEILTETIATRIRASINQGIAVGNIAYHTGVLWFDMLWRHVQGVAVYTDQDVNTLQKNQYRDYFTGTRGTFGLLKDVFGTQGVRAISSIEHETKKRRIEYLVDFLQRYTDTNMVQKYLSQVYAYEHGQGVGLVDGTVVIPEHISRIYTVARSDQGVYAVDNHP